MKRVRKTYLMKLFKALDARYPRAKIALRFGTQMQLLVAVILSAQCTDKKVNEVTKTLFKKYKAVNDFAKADLATFQQEIRSTGFYRNKAKNIINAAKMIQKKFGGKLPKTMEGMLLLPGVARKTANIVLGNAYGIVEGIAVDTHVMRLSQRLGLSAQSTPEKIEKDLMKIIPKERWFTITYQLVDHGRALCKAPRPLCEHCFLNKICPTGRLNVKFKSQNAK